MCKSIHPISRSAVENYPTYIHIAMYRPLYCGHLAHVDSMSRGQVTQYGLT